MGNDVKSRVEQAVRLLAKRRVVVGIPSDATQTTSDGKSAPPLWLIGYINEFGDEELHIPPRPFLVPGVASARKQITKALRMAVAAALAGNVDQMDGHLNAAGEAGKAGVWAKLYDGSLQPLAESTLYKRKHRKHRPNDRESPLVDLGDLRANIRSVVMGK